MLRRRYIIASLTVVSVLMGSLFYHIVTQAQTQQEYNPVADVNRDGIVNILDILRVAVHFGSSYTPITQPNRTTVTVLSYENGSLTFVENALIAVFPATGKQGGNTGIVYTQITNSSGTVSFQLNPNTSYVAVAWDERARYNMSTAFNYDAFTTSSSGEASVTIWLKPHPESTPIRSSPQGWVIMTFYDNSTSELLVYSNPGDGLDVLIREFTADPLGGLSWTSDMVAFDCYVTRGILAVAPDYTLDHPEWNGHNPRNSYAVSFRPGDYQQWPSWSNFTYCTDDSGGAYAVGFYYH